MLSNNDLDFLEKKGITSQQLNSQVERFKTGFPFLALDSSARVGRGILSLSSQDEDQAIARWHQYLADGGDVSKFVPASGAASRMFKALFSFADGDTDELKPGSDVAKLIESVESLPFIDELNATVERLYSKTVKELIAEGRNRDLIAAIIREEGMNYGNLPKGLLTFHRYPDNSTRTPLEEQLVEGAQTATVNGKAKLHFTVSSNHRRLFYEKLEESLPDLEKRLGVKFNVTMSEQKPSTDTVAVNADNTLFREGDKLVFRPGGHGALIENLNDIDSSVVFIKNIDNVVPDMLRVPTLRYKKVLAGVLISVHDRIALYLDMLSGDKACGHDELMIMKQFLTDTLSVVDSRLDSMPDNELATYLRGKFNRPLRVCGMVRNEGEPGGGPFIARNPDGSYSPQILESSQIDSSNASYMKMMSEATHFNPVDLVCYIKDVNGVKFNLPEYVDPDTGFISSKSLHGKELKALELPGLWNGAMSNWSTVFVEVPVATFNPVKTVNDLLRPAHQTN